MGRGARIGRVAIAVALASGAAIGVWLVATGGESDSGDTTTLSIDGTDVDAVSQLAGLELPDSTEDFLTARLDDDTQLDVTFTIDPGDEDALLSNSGFDEPVEGTRVISHSSPLWKLNPQEVMRGAQDTTGDVYRQVELVEEDGRTRVRLVITPA